MLYMSYTDVTQMFSVEGSPRHTILEHFHAKTLHDEVVGWSRGFHDASRQLITIDGIDLQKGGEVARDGGLAARDATRHADDLEAPKYVLHAKDDDEGDEEAHELAHKIKEVPRHEHVEGIQDTKENEFVEVVSVGRVVYINNTSSCTCAC